MNSRLEGLFQYLNLLCGVSGAHGSSDFSVRKAIVRTCKEIEKELGIKEVEEIKEVSNFREKLANIELSFTAHEENFGLSAVDVQWLIFAAKNNIKANSEPKETDGSVNVTINHLCKEYGWTPSQIAEIVSKKLQEKSKMKGLV